MGGLKTFNGGDCLVAAGFLLEASTPFVSLRKILAILGRYLQCTCTNELQNHSGYYMNVAVRCGSKKCVG